MLRIFSIAAGIAALLAQSAAPLDAGLPFPTRTQIDAAPFLAKYQRNVARGLEWLAREQHRDGYWENVDGGHRVAFTALAGLALLADGSGAGQGKYAKHLEKAAAWLRGQQQKNGLIADMNNENERHRYMFGHGFAVTFLSQCYALARVEEARRELGDTLERAIAFSLAAQTVSGGWGYVAAKDGGDFSENIATMPQVQSLLAARKAGIAVPKKLIDKMLAHLESSTIAARKDGKMVQGEAGIVYSPIEGMNGEIRLLATAGAAGSCLIDAAGQAKQLPLWLNYCRSHMPATSAEWRDFSGVVEYLHYFIAAAAYLLGEDGHGKLSGDRKTFLRWSDYRAAAFPAIVSGQNQDGSWQTPMPVLATSVYLIVLQLDRGYLPMYRRQPH